MTQKRYEISDEQWLQIKDLLPISKIGRPPKDNRLMFNAILWIARSGAAWRDDGTLLTIFKHLKSDADYENLSIDSTSVKTHQHNAGAKKGQ